MPLQRASADLHRVREYRCGRCGKTYTSNMRLQHHKAAEHTPKNLGDIRTMKHIKHSTGS